MRITRRALASTYVLRHLITAALDFGTGKRRSTPGMEYDFESEEEDEEDLSPRNGSWTGVRIGGETEEDRSPQWSWTGDVPESLQRVASRKLGQ